ncbi:MAG: hypothetical protein IPM59_01615 [Chloracidobacterium sp.]|nr:hypothetical protein [Chloracidobacterium sp.]
MRSISFLILAIVLLECPGLAQKNADLRVQAVHPVVDRRKPSVYFEVVNNRRLEVIDPEDGLVWLRLRNNSRWGIRVQMSGGRSKSLGDVRLYYDILNAEEAIVEKKRCHVCSSNIVKPGKGVLFAVPSDILPTGFSLRVKFSFDWEDDFRIAPASEPVHYVFFSSYDLPEKGSESSEL